MHFLEISDHKAVYVPPSQFYFLSLFLNWCFHSLEMALRNIAALTQGDIIEISYNSIVFDLLVMEAHPGGGGSASSTQTSKSTSPLLSVTRSLHLLLKPPKAP